MLASSCCVETGGALAGGPRPMLPALRVLTDRLLGAIPVQVIKANDDLTPEHHQFFLYQMLRGLKYIHSAKVGAGGGAAGSGTAARARASPGPPAPRPALWRQQAFTPCPYAEVLPLALALPGVPPRLEAQEHPGQLGLQAQDLRFWAGAPRIQRHAAGGPQAGSGDAELVGCWEGWLFTIGPRCLRLHVSSMWCLSE